MTRLAPLAPRASATVAAEQALRRAILDGTLAAGERLPPERELSETLGISRLTLRAALATLSAAGLLAVRHGSGYVVQDFRATGGSDLLAGLVELAGERGTLAATAADLLRVRRHLATAVLDTLAERPPTAAARRAVHGAIDRFSAEVAAGAGPDRLAAADLAIVRALLDATGSAILRACLNPVVAVVDGCAPLRAAIYAEPRGNADGWRALAAWLDRPDPAAVPLLVAVLADRDRTTVERIKKPRRSR
jgi:GntR family transcriptional repressor for pyruvate dehydrogenase complex